MKKKYMSVIVAGISISILAGCQNTPEKSIVKQKGADNIKEYESAKNSIQEMVQAPETYKNQASYQNGILTVDTDAPVILPKVDSMNTYKVSAEEVSQEMIDKVTEIFFPDGKFYHSYTYLEWTKDQYQEEITRLKKYKAEGNLDPYKHGTDENGELYFNIDEVIAKDEEKMKNAPEEVKKEELEKPVFGLQWVSGKGEDAEIWVDENAFYGVVETDQGNYNYQIHSEDNSADLRFRIEKMRDDIPDPQEFTTWHEGRYILDREGEGYNYMSEDKIKNLIGISYEDAEKTAREKIEQLGWDWEINAWDYSVFYHGEEGVKESNILDAGYIFYFTRMVDGVPITYTDSYGGGLEDMDSTLIPWSYERCEVIVGDDGIEKVEIYNPYKIEEIQTENVELMDFDNIIEIYEQMMEISNADISEFEKSRTYHIKKITLGYSRIYDPTVDNTSGILVPVWDFFGGFDIENDEYSEKNSGEHSQQSFMTINAIDGTVIDRELGY